MAMKFYNVLKANAEIIRLQSDLDAATSKLSEIVASESQVLIELQTELDTAKSAALSLRTELDATKLALASAISERDVLVVAADALKASVGLQASTEAAAIVSTLGVPPVATTPTSIPDPGMSLATITDPIERSKFIAANLSKLFVATPR